MAIASFLDVVVNCCKKIIRDYGFRLRTGSDSYVELVSESVILTFAYARSRGHEVSIGIASKSMEDAGIIAYNLGEVMREYEVPRSEQLQFLQSSSMDRIAEYLSDVCEALLEHCRPILKGDQDAFQRVRVRRAAESRHYSLELGLRGIRHEVEEAWRTKDYAKYCKLLAGFETVLSESEKKKLVYAAAK